MQFSLPLQDNRGADGAPSSGRTHRFKLVGFLALVTACEVLLHFVFDKKTDFGVFCYAARMIRDGQGPHLYDAAAQLSYQAKFGRPLGLDFYYPAIVAVFYLPLTYLPDWLAFGVWTALNLALLCFTVFRLNRYLNVAEGNWPILIVLASYPVSECLANGQVSILVFSLVAFSFLAWKDRRDTASGLLLGLLAFKFQLLLGIGALSVLNRRFRLFGGMVLGAVPIALISIWIVGWEAVLQYPAFLKQTAMRAGAELNPLAMSNLRALIYFVIRRDPPMWSVATCSLALIVWMATRKPDREAWFCAALVVSLLVSFHLYPPELTLLFLPIGFLVMRTKKHLPWHAIVPLVFFVLPPLLLASNLYPLLALPIFYLAYVIAQRQRVDELYESSGATA